MRKGIVIIPNEPHGYHNGMPYEILEFEKADKSYEYIECNINEINEIEGATPLDKWVWLIIKNNSCPSCVDGFNMFLFHVTPEELAVLLNEPLNDIVMSIEHLIKMGRLMRYDIEGKSNIYAAL